MSSIFWGLRLEPGKRYSTIVDNSFHVSKAALDCSSVKNDTEIVSVMLEEGESRTSFILCNLQKSKELQSNLDLNFMSGDQVTFFCKGNGVVHLSGYIILEDDDEMGGMGEEEEEDEDEEEGDLNEDSVEGVMTKLNGMAQKRKKASTSKADSKKLKLNEDEDEEDSDDDEDDDVVNDMNLAGLGGSDDDEDESDEDDDDEEDEEESDDDEEEEEEEEEEDEPPKQILNNKQKNKGKGQQNQTTAPGSKQGTPIVDKQKTPKSQQKTPNQQQQQQLSGKKDKKKGDTPRPQNKSISEEVASSPKLTPKTVQGGVIVKDIKVGNGPVCKNGKMVSVYYTGRLKSNNKVFDSTTQGSGFQFRLGKGEVIKGWDVGLQGMKVGGKRVITCPPQMAYGQKGSPPTIPGNSTLTFEVELRAIH